MADNVLARLDFVATFGKVVTCKDGGIKLTLDVPDSDMMTAAGLMGFASKILKVNIAVVEPDVIGGGSQ